MLNCGPTKREERAKKWGVEAANPLASIDKAKGDTDFIHKIKKTSLNSLIKRSLILHLILKENNSKVSILQSKSTSGKWMG